MLCGGDAHAGGLAAHLTQHGEFCFDVLEARAYGLVQALSRFRGGDAACGPVVQLEYRGRRSSARTVWLKADCVTPSCAAARVTATALGDITGVIHAAGVSPSQASLATILKVDLYGTALVLEAFGDVIARGGAGVVIASQSGHRLPALTPDQNIALATTPTEALLALAMLQPDQVKDSLHAYQISKRGNSLRVMAEAVRWGKRGARVNTISPGIIFTPLARDELNGPRGEGYRRMIDASAAKRGGTPDDVGTSARC